MFNNFLDRVHIDEKWFFITRDHSNYILLDEWDNCGAVVESETGPVRKVRHKSHIQKVSHPPTLILMQPVKLTPIILLAGNVYLCTGPPKV